MARGLVAAALIAAGCAPGFAAQADAPALEQAMNDFEQGRYARAEQGLRAAAERGDPRAQELLGFMYASGPKTYPGIALNREEAVLWFERAARGGSASARYMFCSLTRQVSAYQLGSVPCSGRRRDAGEQAERD